MAAQIWERQSKRTMTLFRFVILAGVLLVGESLVEYMFRMNKIASESFKQNYVAKDDFHVRYNDWEEKDRLKETVSAVEEHELSVVNYKGAPLTAAGTIRGEKIFTVLPEAKLFVFQTSGGFNNQRIILERALRICEILQRVCVIPMAGRHTSLFPNYNKLGPNDLFEMDRILDFQVMSKVGVQLAPLSVPFSEFLLRAREEVPDPHDWLVVEQNKLEKKNNPITMANLTAWTSSPKKIIYFSGPTMWQRFGSKTFENRVYQFIRYSPYFRAITRDIIKALQLHNNYVCIHSRASDHGEKWERWMQKKEGEKLASPKGAKQVPSAKYVHSGGFSSRYVLSEETVQDPGLFLANQLVFTIKMHGLPISSLKRVYIATKPSVNLAMYQNFTNQYTTFFSRDIPQHVITHFQSVFNLPKQKKLYNDLLGIVEQLICAQSYLYIGYKGSSFAEYIYRLRNEPLENFLPENSQVVEDNEIQIAGTEANQEVNEAISSTSEGWFLEETPEP